jgi:pimeloyl-ACP methyl ester carboxylesterase
MPKSTYQLKSIPGLTFERWGPDKPSQTVIFLHGLGASRRQWFCQLPVFSKEFDVIAWDARGFGDSLAAGLPVSIAGFASDLLALIKELKLEKVILVGSSLGGRIALEFASRYPEHLAGLVLCDAYPGMGAWFMPRKLLALAVRWRLRHLYSGKKTLAQIAEQMAPRLGTRASSASVLMLLKEGLSRCDRKSFLKAVEVVFADTAAPDLTAIQVPTLVLSGTKDKITPPFIARYLAGKIPKAQLAWLENCGHVGNLERPEIFNPLLRFFLISLKNELNHCLFA